MPKNESKMSRYKDVSRVLSHEILRTILCDLEIQLFKSLENTLIIEKKKKQKWKTFSLMIFLIRMTFMACDIGNIGIHLHSKGINGVKDV
ncbi:Hypothetical predicted protein [Octopus vulgaris]|uniref:Uncharacterized protein n=1 Tax=Octopus vulgaris TaxID=6645 RepID=A0AA36B365_OCTVU|nr:Hypothetical predicted protein [Octopus vulgaris]